MDLNFMDETLGPIVARGNQCIDPEDLQIEVTDDLEQRPYKLAMLLCMLIVYAYTLAGYLH